MKPEVVEYGYRSRSTGRYVRLDEQVHDDGYDNGARLVRTLTFEEGFPILQETDLQAIVAFRYGEPIGSAIFHDFVATPDVDVEDLEAVEFYTTVIAAGGGAARFVTDAKPMHLDIVRNVKLDVVAHKGQGAMSLTGVFGKDAVASMLEAVGRPDTSWLKLVELKEDLGVADPEDLVGKVLVCDPTIRPLKISGAHGVLGACSVEGKTYLAVVFGCSYPFFYSTELSQEMGRSEEQEWDDVRVSFAFDGSEERAAELLQEILERDEDEGPWPSGWALHEICGFGEATFAVFSVTVPLERADAARVRLALREIEAGHDLGPDPAPHSGL